MLFIKKKKTKKTHVSRPTTAQPKLIKGQLNSTNESWRRQTGDIQEFKNGEGKLFAKVGGLEKSNKGYCHTRRLLGIHKNAT